MEKFSPTFGYKLIYIFRINDKAHKGYLKIGEATIFSDNVDALVPNCRALNLAAKERINQYTSTAGIAYELLHTEIAMRTVIKDGKEVKKSFRDHAIHDVLRRSGIKNHYFDTEKKQNEWFECDLETAKNAIAAYKQGRASLSSVEISADRSPVVLYPKQKEAVRDTITQFGKGDRMLWNAKMRFGKTLTALEVVKEMGFKRTLIFTHRPVVSESWYEDFQKIFYDTDYKFGSKTIGEDIENLINEDSNFVYFASLQDLRSSSAVGGKFDKNEYIFLLEWDFVVIDEAHEGTQTKLGQDVINAVLNAYPDRRPKLLELSGTPFNLLTKYSPNEMFTWDYVMEQEEKNNWYIRHFGDTNPYADMPRLEIYTYDLDKLMPGYTAVEDKSFNFREFFRTWTGEVEKDYKPIPPGKSVGDFVHEEDVLKFLDMLIDKSTQSNYPYSTEEYRSYFRHTLWMVPGVKEAAALSKLMQRHPVFGCGQFKYANVAGDGDEEEKSDDAMAKVRSAIGDDPDDHYSVTISCGRLTTGVTIPEWTAVFMLAGSFSTAASQYLQTIFRVQSPANINGRTKERCAVFDFAPDRTLKMVSQARQLSVKQGSTDNDRVLLGDLLNYCPVIAIDGSTMQPYSVDNMMQQLKQVYIERVARNGFDDAKLYNYNLLKLDNIELQEFEALKKIVGSSKAQPKQNDVDINNQGYTAEEYAELERVQKKPKKQLTDEEKRLLAERKEKQANADKARSILRAISIRIPLLIYGADISFDKDITVDNFVDLFKDDDISWNEFMPKGVTKEIFKKFTKYYDTDVFVAAGREIRNKAKSADALPPAERVQRIAALFSQFKNPDKETVLTPWRVVNMHLGDTLGGYNFYNESYSDTIEEPRFIDHGKATQQTFANTDAHILEINSKTGLYPLYATYSIYRKRLDAVPENERTLEKQREIWRKTVEENIFVICKTPMAKAITRRTLLGYGSGKINAHYFDDLINQLKNKPENFIAKVTKGSYWNRRETVMNFDVVIGNPPYQVMDGGAQASATPVYNYFVLNAEKLNPSYVSMIMPAKWYSGGKGLDEFRNTMLNDYRIAVLCDHFDSDDCFPSADISGGVCYFLWDAEKNNKNCNVISYLSNCKTEMIRPLLEDETNLYIRFNQAVSIYRKCCQSNEKFDTLVSYSKPFGLRTYVTGEDKSDKNTVKLYANRNVSKEDRYIDIKNVPQNKELINTYKVFVSAAYGERGDFPYYALGTPFYGDLNTCCTETFLYIGPFPSKEVSFNVISYIKTKFFRFLVLLVKNTQHAARNVYQFVPVQDFTNNSDIDWSKPVAEIDQQLYAKYSLSPDEITFIESMIKPME